MKIFFCVIVLFTFSNKIIAQTPVKEIDSLEEVIIMAEQMPSFVGGEDSLYSFLYQQIVYPKLAKENQIEGRVILSFIVEKDGSLTNFEVLKKMGWGCDEEAIRILKLTSKWMPGKMMGKVKRVKFTLPILFRL
ncbi:MAG: energy transducer TonB [Candidatus Methylacidiphilales bacterium]